MQLVLPQWGNLAVGSWKLGGAGGGGGELRRFDAAQVSRKNGGNFWIFPLKTLFWCFFGDVLFSSPLQLEESKIFFLR